MDAKQKKSAKTTTTPVKTKAAAPKQAKPKAEPKKVEEAPVDLLDILLDKDNKDPIVLMNERGKEISFEQIAIIPYEEKNNKTLYCILKPIEKIAEMADDEALVFAVDQDKNGNTILRFEKNESVALSVFDKYYDLLEEARAKSKKKAQTKAPATKTATKTATATTAKKTTAAKKPAVATKAAGKKTTKK